VRQELLQEVALKTALQGWRARGERDLGLMWLEMWAYAADVLGFYDERIANESYIRTAMRRPSLRRIVDLLGYVPAPGVAGSVTLAAIADGRTAVQVPGRTGFRSDAFGNEPPQVFELGQATSIHPFKNSWELGPVPLTKIPVPPPDPVPLVIVQRDELVFDTANFGLAKDRYVLVLHPVPEFIGPQVRKVVSVTPFEGKDEKTYIRVKLDAEIDVSTIDPIGDIRILTPTVTAVPSKNRTDPIAEEMVTLDAVYRQLHASDLVLAVHEASGARETLQVEDLEDEFDELIEGSDPFPPVQVPVTTVRFTSPVTIFDDESSAPEDRPRAFTFHFSFVDAGRLTLVADNEPTASSLRASSGVPVTGLVEVPPGSSVDEPLEQNFLLRDADNQGALVLGEMTFSSDGTARFRVKEGELPERMKTPITVFGNLLEATRGETVFNEVLGSGDGRILHQRFKLKKKPLTYVFDETANGINARSTLRIAVDRILWREVRSFFGTGPEDHVYIVRTDDAGNTFITFGDGVRGARLPSGVQNVIATYRFGAGEAAPPENAIRQLARAVKGLRRVESPIPAVIGKDPDPPETLRTSAPTSLLTFGRAVSAADFEAFASLLPGVIRAVAEFLWIEEQQEAGVVVTYIGSADEDDVLSALRDEAEPNLPLVAKRSTPWMAEFDAEVEVDPRFNPEMVAQAVKAALIDDESGPLSKRNVPIGQLLFRSVIFDVIHDVPGVVSIQSATLTHFFPGSSVPIPFNFKDSASRGVCTLADGHHDFADGENVTVTGTLATAPVLELETSR
jgi:hypothetical protein